MFIDNFLIFINKYTSNVCINKVCTLSQYEIIFKALLIINNLLNDKK
jgi:hypothetical protein